MEILFVTSELSPFSRSTTVADHAAALPKALRGLGHKVTVLSPLYANIDLAARSLARRLSPLNVEVRGKPYSCTVYDGRTTGGVDLVFLENAELFRSRHAGEGDAETQVLAALLLGAAAAQFAQKREPAYDIVHAYDFAAAATLAYARAMPACGRVLSLCDTRVPGALSPALLDVLALPAHIREQIPTHEPSLLGTGIHASELVIADSTTGARAMLDDSSSPLSPLLHEKGIRFVGIVNGIDAAIWNPLTDSSISARFDPVDLSGKTRCKGALQFLTGLHVDPNIPVIVTAGTLDAANGGDLLAQIAEQVSRGDVQLLVLGHGGVAHDVLHALATNAPDRVALRPEPSDKELHLALAGSDFYLLPARSTHDLDIALCALRYGSLPIARPVGALADTLVDADANLETGNAFLCESDTAEELLGTIQRALGAYAKHHAFEAFRKRTMRTDVSWERAARRYEHAYKQLKAATAAAA